MRASNSIINSADNTTVVGLITKNDETAYREEVRALGVWLQENNLSLNINKTKKMIVDYRKQHRDHTVFYTIYCILPMTHAIAHPYIYISMHPITFVCIR
jgi:hypothetical protein